jgi:hypothetical protein
LPVRTGTPYLPWHAPREATRLLRYVLHRQGFTHTFQSGGKGMPVHSVSTELTVRCEDGSFVVWNEEGGAPVTHPIDDPVGAARRIAARRRQRPPLLPTDSVREPTV